MAKNGKKKGYKPPQESPGPVGNTYEDAASYFSDLNKKFSGGDSLDFLHPEHDASKKKIAPETHVDKKYKADQGPPEPHPEQPPPEDIPPLVEEESVEENHSIDKVVGESYPESIFTPGKVIAEENDSTDIDGPNDQEISREFPIQLPENPVGEIVIAEPITPDPYDTSPHPESSHVIDRPPEESSPSDFLEEMETQQSLPQQFAKAMRAKEIPIQTQLAIGQFSSHYNSAKEFISKRKHDIAHEHYTQMLRHYQDIKEQDIAAIHKQVAHHGLEEIYDDLKGAEQHSPITKKTFVTMMIATVLLLLVGVTLVLNPSISGLAVLENTIPTYTGSSSFEIFGPRKIDLSDQFSINPDNLAILGTRTDHADIEVDGTSIIIVPEPGFAGDEDMTLIAVNTATSPHRMTKVPIHLIIR